MIKLEGIITALITPFKNGDIDYTSLKRLVRAQLEDGIDGLVVHGTTAESPTTTEKEKEKIFDIVKSEVSGQIPLIVGTGSNSTSESLQKSQAAEKWGADALLTVVPYYNKPPQRGLYQHFSAIAGAVETPVILYNVPGRTVTSLDIETIAALSENKKIIGIKEATGNVEFGEEIIRKCRKGFVVLSGDDKTCMSLAVRGGRGVIAVVSHVITKQMKACYKKIKHGDLTGEKDYQRYFDLIDKIYIESNPIPIKYAVQKRGLIDSAEMRLPMVELKDEHKKTLDAALEVLN